MEGNDETHSAVHEEPGEGAISTHQLSAGPAVVFPVHEGEGIPALQTGFTEGIIDPSRIPDVQDRSPAVALHRREVAEGLLPLETHVTDRILRRLGLGICDPGDNNSRPK